MIVPLSCPTRTSPVCDIEKADTFPAPVYSVTAAGRTCPTLTCVTSVTELASLPTLASRQLHT